MAQSTTLEVEAPYSSVDQPYQSPYSDKVMTMPVIRNETNESLIKEEVGKIEIIRNKREYSTINSLTQPAFASSSSAVI
ncbi:MAG: hypothetical protein ACJAS3_000679 [Roseivirga sp.]|jgi:hypothetical protein